MSNSANLGLPFVQAAQAQKHVTVNESLIRLDGLCQLALVSATTTTPPAVVLDGACYGVPAGGVNAWAGKDGQVAIGTNGGWDFAVPKSGWRAFIADQGTVAIHDGVLWRSGQMTMSAKGAGLSLRVVEFDHTVGAGAQSLTGLVIPPDAVVFGVTGRVITALTGTLTAWSLGNSGAVGRFGTGLGLAAESFVRGVPGQPMTYYSATALQLDATGGAFAGGTVRLAVHFAELAIPGP
ncbi:MAG: DUF2793 domain-containing protein [Paracoccaceae bacterium]